MSIYCPLFLYAQTLLKIKLKKDALSVIKAIEAQSWDLSPEGPIFDEIKLLAAQVEVVTWTKIPRTNNAVAHSFARAAIHASGPGFWKESPWLENLICNEIYIGVGVWHLPI